MQLPKSKLTKGILIYGLRCSWWHLQQQQQLLLLPSYASAALQQCTQILPDHASNV
jgi:hypothetical protein